MDGTFHAATLGNPVASNGSCVASVVDCVPTEFWLSVARDADLHVDWDCHLLDWDKAPRDMKPIPLLLIVLVLVAPASAQLVVPDISQEAMTLDLDSAATKRLASIEDFVAEKQWDAVATLLRQTQSEKADKLVAIAPGWYVSVARFCQSQATLLPKPGLIAYRRQVDATAKKWFDDIQDQRGLEPSRQRAAWLRIVRQAFASSSADEALARLAEQSFERADYAAARTYWELLLPASGPLRSAAGLGLLRHPDPNSDAAQIRAQLILCSLFEKDPERVSQEIAAFRRLHGNSAGRIAGRDGILVDLLSSMIADQEAGVSKANEMTSLDRHIWTVELPNGSETGFAEMIPVVAGETLFVSNGESVFAFTASSGQPKWSETAEPARDPQASVIHALADPVAPKRPIDGHARHSLSVYGDRLYARLGTSITGKAKQETNAHSELVGLDVGDGEGKLVWRIDAKEIDPQDPLSVASPWCFEGPPAADSQRVLVVLRRSLPQEQLNVACFDADTARLIWNRKVGITVASTEEAVNSTSHLELTVAEDTAFVSTDAGTIVAIDVHDGAIRWARTYVSDAVNSSRDGRREGHTPPIYHDGVLYVAPLDTDLLMAIHAESGLLLWQHQWPDPIRYVLGVAKNTLIVQGRSLWGVTLTSGKSAWPHRRVGNEDPEGFSAGRGVLIHGDVCWPNRDELVMVASDSGQILRRIAVRESLGLSGGHLTNSGASLTISRGAQLSVFGLHH